MENTKKYFNMAYEEASSSSMLDMLGAKERHISNYTRSEFEVNDAALSEKLGIKEGKYVSYVADQNLIATRQTLDISKYIAKDLTEIANLNAKEKVLVVGIGNEDIVADSLGSMTIEKLYIPAKKRLMLLKTGVLGKCHIVTREHIKGVVSSTKPSLVIIIDSLATSRIDRVFSSYQLSTAALIPGGGLGSVGEEISEEYLGVPTISLGVPLVIYLKNILKTFIVDSIASSSLECQNDMQKCLNSYLSANMSGVALSPKEVDILVDKCSDVLSHAICRAFC